MNDILLNIALFTIGVFLLYYGAEYLVRGGANIARILNIKPIVIGLTVVAFGTSMPEFLVGFSAVFKNENAIAIGNVVGSNIANIALILGLAALASPIVISYKLVKKELIFLIIMSLFFSAMLLGGVGLIKGLIFLTIIISYTVYHITHAGEHPVSEELPEKDESVLNNVFFIALGLIGLVLGSNWLVDSAVFLARLMNISEIVIGMTIVAVGTSLPELAASVVASMKKQSDISIGNIIGSNIFNMFFVIGGVSVFQPIPVDPSIFYFEIPIMLLFVALLFIIIFVSKGIKRWQGALLLTGYVFFNFYLFFIK